MTPPSRDFSGIRWEIPVCTGCWTTPPADCECAPDAADADRPIWVMPVSEHEAVLDEIRALLPKVYDGLHLTDCPYVDVLMRIRAALDGGPE